jgi:hypothetical protein
MMMVITILYGLSHSASLSLIVRVLQLVHVQKHI